MAKRIKVSHGFSLNKSEVVVYKRVLTRANFCTAVGLMATAFYTLVFLTETMVWLILPFFILVVLSDLLDGLCASWYDEHTYVGSIIDPLRDRLFTFAVLGNVWFVSPNEVVNLLIGVVVFELGNAFLTLLTKKEVHLIGKIRFLVHIFCGLQFVLQSYSQSWWLVTVDTWWLMLISLLASGVNLVCTIGRVTWKLR